MSELSNASIQTFALDHSRCWCSISYQTHCLIDMRDVLPVHSCLRCGDLQRWRFGFCSLQYSQPSQYMLSWFST